MTNYIGFVLKIVSAPGDITDFKLSEIVFWIEINKFIFGIINFKDFLSFKVTTFPNTVLQSFFIGTFD
jgi:hypothetical protein